MFRLPRRGLLELRKGGKLQSSIHHMKPIPSFALYRLVAYLALAGILLPAPVQSLTLDLQRRDQATGAIIAEAPNGSADLRRLRNRGLTIQFS